MATVTEPPQATATTCLVGDLAWLLTQAQVALARELTLAFEPLGLSMRAVHVLAAATEGEFTQKQLADTVGLDKTTMVATIDELEQAGLAQRRPSESDRRARVIEVTTAGHDVVARGTKIAAELQDQVLATLPAHERDAFVGALRSLVCNRLSEPVQCSRAPRRREPRA